MDHFGDRGLPNAGVATPSTRHHRHYRARQTVVEAMVRRFCMLAFNHRVLDNRGHHLSMLFEDPQNFLPAYPCMTSFFA